MRPESYRGSREYEIYEEEEDSEVCWKFGKILVPPRRSMLLGRLVHLMRCKGVVISEKPRTQAASGKTLILGAWKIARGGQLVVDRGQEQPETVLK